MRAGRAAEAGVGLVGMVEWRSASVGRGARRCRASHARDALLSMQIVGMKVLTRAVSAARRLRARVPGVAAWWRGSWDAIARRYGLYGGSVVIEQSVYNYDHGMVGIMGWWGSWDGGACCGAWCCGCSIVVTLTLRRLS